MTDAMKAALEWLRKRGGDGVFQRILSDDPDHAPGTRYNAMLAAGEIAPFWWKTWLRLVEAGKIEEYRVGKARRFRIAEGA